MFNGKLELFQLIHEKNLIDACKTNTKLVLDAPTGSGKTVLVTKFIDEYLDRNPDTVFFWFCPGSGGLHNQSRSVFEYFTEGIITGDIYNFISDYSPEGNVYFVNWDKINSTNNIVLRDGEDKNLLEKIVECRVKNIDFFMIVDEEHLNGRAADLYERTLSPKHVLRISATTRSREGHIEKVTDDEVIKAGLIASGIAINEGLSAETELNDDYADDLLLLHMADDKRKAIQAEYDKRNLAIRPLVLIQFPNGSDEWIERIKAELTEMGYTEKNGLVTSWFSGDHPSDPEELDKLNGRYSFLLFKQAIATGWDCPRAKILVKLREGTSETFDIQTIGRIRRMPERHHYESELLDYCYVYTLDDKFTEGLTSSIKDSYYIGKYLKKKDAPNITLTKEYLPTSDREAVDDEIVVRVLSQKLLAECDVDQNGFVTKEELELTKGFQFGTKLRTEAIEGFARTTEELVKLKAQYIGEHEINLHDDGPLIRNAKRKIAQSIGIDENVSSKALGVLFNASTLKVPSFNGVQIPIYTDDDKELDLRYKVIEGLGKREYNAFLVNNWELLCDILKGIDAEDIELKEADTIVSDWTIPPIQEYKRSTQNPSSKFLKKNMFDGYGVNILADKIRSKAEIAFEQWCEISDKVEWYYTNGDKGQDFFTIIYRTTFRRYNFYPDYIVKMKNGDTWIIEVKGGMSGPDKTANIDTEAKFKFEALKQYGEAHPEVKWGFARNEGVKVFLSNTEWDENMYNQDVWKPIDSFL